jgi:hypothetical protein
VASTRGSKRTALRAYVDAHRPELIDESAFGDLVRLLAPVSENYLRRLLRESGVSLAPLVEGVRQDSFEQLERTLEAIGREYAGAVAAGAAPRAQACRRAVITAKDHARLALRKLTGADRDTREEMVLWMLTWLENPGIFSAWLSLRKRTRCDSDCSPPAGAVV